jgi:hypothetical protein
MTMNAVLRSTFVFTVSLAAAACSQSGERVFTRQNQAASALATMGMEAETRSPDKLDMIYAAETKLHEACEPIQTVASRRMTGEDVGIDTQLVALISLDRCESETSRAEGFIWTDNPAVARIYLGSKTAQEAAK